MPFHLATFLTFGKWGIRSEFLGKGSTISNKFYCLLIQMYKEESW